MGPSLERGPDVVFRGHLFQSFSSSMLEKKGEAFPRCYANTNVQSSGNIIWRTGNWRYKDIRWREALDECMTAQAQNMTIMNHQNLDPLETLTAIHEKWPIMVSMFSGLLACRPLYIASLRHGSELPTLEPYCVNTGAPNTIQFICTGAPRAEDFHCFIRCGLGHRI